MGNAEPAPALVTPEEYLATEAVADRKHEYVGGVVYADAGGSYNHNLIASNVLGLLYGQLRGRPCRALNSDTKVRVRFPTHTLFYYPDVQVVCRPSPAEQMYQDEPAVVIEVISESTRRTDEQEKRAAYLSIPSVHAYILLEQGSATATVWRRHSAGFRAERWTGLDATVPLPEIGCTLPLAEAYETVNFDASTDSEGAR